MANWQVHYSNKIAICTSIFSIPSQGVNTPCKTQVTSLPSFPFGYFPLPPAVKYVNSEVEEQFYFPYIAVELLHWQSNVSYFQKKSFEKLKIKKYNYFTASSHTWTEKKRQDAFAWTRTCIACVIVLKVSGKELCSLNLLTLWNSIQ